MTGVTAFSNYFLMQLFPKNVIPIICPKFAINFSSKFQISIGQGWGRRLGRIGGPQPWPIEIWNLKLMESSENGRPTTVRQYSDDPPTTVRRKKSWKTKCVSNDRSRHDDSNRPRIVKIGAILAIFEHFKVFGRSKFWEIWGGVDKSNCRAI